MPSRWDTANRGWRRRVFHCPPPTLLSGNFRLPCAIELQPFSLTPLKMRKVQLVWYVGMRQTDPTWVEENRGPAWSSHPILIEPEQLPGPIAPASCKEGPTRKGRRSHRRYRWKENRDS